MHPEENRVNQVVDRVNATGTTWLGTTMECAQCHSHKYDPVSQEEYYQLFAFFNNTPLEVKGKRRAFLSISGGQLWSYPRIRAKNLKNRLLRPTCKAKEKELAGG